MSRYHATVTREDGWWMIHVRELDAVTQAARYDEIWPQTRGLIAAETELPEAEVSVDFVDELNLLPLGAEIDREEAR